MSIRFFLNWALLFLAGALFNGIQAQTLQNSKSAVCLVPEKLDFQVISKIERSSVGFTQGLIYRNGTLLESVGVYGESGLNQIKIPSGAVKSLYKNPKKVFGEGLILDGESIFQLTWKEHILFKYSLSSGEMKSIAFPYLGWGIAQAQNSLGKVWVTSDGTDRLRFFRSAPVYGRAWNSDNILRVRRGALHDTQPEIGINALSYVPAGEKNSGLYANIFQKTVIDRIDLDTGCVSGVLDLKELVADSGVDLEHSPEFVLNGIAFRPETHTFFVTGKNWPKIYEIKIK